jgi:nucleoside triphosphate pyrophosphatase
VSRFILASGSPRRTQLLIEAGFHPEIVPPSTTELHTDYLTPRELTLFNAHRKALAVALLHPDAVVLGADTLVALGTKVFGKPAGFAEAREMLLELSGKSHEVITSVSVIHAARGLVVTESVHSTVTFKVLDDAAIERYFQLVHPLDKAGAYAAQIDSTSIIERVDGSFTNVVGLPMEMVTALLREFGIEPG